MYKIESEDKIFPKYRIVSVTCDMCSNKYVEQGTEFRLIEYWEGPETHRQTICMHCIGDYLAEHAFSLSKWPFLQIEPKWVGEAVDIDGKEA